jgi:hypothetical protein
MSSASSSAGFSFLSFSYICTVYLFMLFDFSYSRIIYRSILCFRFICYWLSDFILDSSLLVASISFLRGWSCSASFDWLSSFGRSEGVFPSALVLIFGGSIIDDWLGFGVSYFCLLPYSLVVGFFGI